MMTRNLTRSTLAGCALAVLVALTTAGTASADFTADCTHDGYLAMNNVFYADRDYLTVGTYGGMFSGYAFLKFDESNLPDAPVDAAYLNLHSIPQVGGGMFPPPEDAPVSMNVHSALADVADIVDLASATAYLSNIGTASDTITVSGGDGMYTLDVTDIVNGWVTSGDNFGLFLTVPNDLGFAKFHSMETTTGLAPTISSVPEPATMALLSLGGLGMLIRRKRQAVA